MCDEAGPKEAETVSCGDAELQKDGSASPLDRQTQDAIGDMLRRHYDSLVEEQVPERIKRLWEQLEHRT